MNVNFKGLEKSTSPVQKNDGRNSNAYNYNNKIATFSKYPGQ